MTMPRPYSASVYYFGLRISPPLKAGVRTSAGISSGVHSSPGGSRAGTIDDRGSRFARGEAGCEGRRGDKSKVGRVRQWEYAESDVGCLVQVWSEGSVTGLRGSKDRLANATLAPKGNQGSVGRRLTPYVAVLPVTVVSWVTQPDQYCTVFGRRKTWRGSSAIIDARVCALSE